MQIQLWQIIILGLLGGIAQWDETNTKIGFRNPVVTGLIVGIIMGDLKTGLLVGGTLQLLTLGIGTYGGASIPDYATATIIAGALAISTGKGTDFAIGIGVPAALLLVQLDVLARMSNVFFQHRAEKYAGERKYEKLELMNILGLSTWLISRFIPIFICLYFGEGLVKQLLAVSPAWLMGGLKVAGGVLPALGVALLLKYLPIKAYAAYFIVGFVLVAYLNMPMTGVALLGFAAAFYNFKKLQNQSVNNNVVIAYGGGSDEDE
ncbi:PTS sugar transporter subunit IIC [Clostridium swellfunianum]|uniref:PTS mannose/fructose/sorbose/N-acetylgalactosamine transporter subunit IIC n=1 Tax=Clostridium swellfunianum TaxID=1367462 RepID=UPI00202F58CF|nr:PTS sugar transporter subunit IIC [Clostridium swellfunianum]MCM0648991.1 PTS sugar transporter subunit IIC [Clostridium swellfunianum]